MMVFKEKSENQQGLKEAFILFLEQLNSQDTFPPFLISHTMDPINELIKETSL